MSEHVLVVGGGRELPGLLRDLGARTSVICQLSLLPRLRDVAGHERVVALPGDSDDSDWIAQARHIDSHDRITRIATFGERDQNRAAVIGSALGLPCMSQATVTAVHDKSVMRRVLADAGVEKVQSTLAMTADEVVAWVTAHGGRWVVKPVDGSGSAGVTVVDDAVGAAAAYDRCVKSAHTGHAGASAVLVEEYLDGPQISVETVSEDGEHVVVATTRKYSDARTLVELGHVVPANLPTDAAAAYVPEILTALGVGFGVGHTEMVLTARGPRVIETHIRLAGDEIPYLVRDAVGVDLVDCLVRQTLGERVLPSVSETLADSVTREAQAIWFGTAPCAGTLEGVHGAGPSITREIEDGQPVTELRDSSSRTLWARASAPTPEQALDAARRAVANCTLSIRTPTTEDLTLI